MKRNIYDRIIDIMITAGLTTIIVLAIIEAAIFVNTHNMEFECNSARAAYGIYWNP